jgi:hypothetical protein
MIAIIDQDCGILGSQACVSRACKQLAVLSAVYAASAKDKSDMLPLFLRLRRAHVAASRLSSLDVWST